ncbi:hypothetical protein DEM27_10440 [Metarhizobium album]|uniref:Uncharacterized protein n=1 Tax=Metarhizobium album TaxID=2182425 RepID=A0A2U2DTZ2_9HYPH|nr:hypothetical protein [Rhizobium album]PWE56772.1 hypothetical protein DEM27_10440 [Rhizobium album]
MTTETSIPDEKDTAAQNQDVAADEAAIWDELEAADKPDDQPPLEEGREGTPGEPAAVVATEVEKTADQAQPAAIDPQIWSDPEKARQAYEALQAEKNKVEQKLRSDEGRQAALQRRIRELQNTIQTPAAAGDKDHRKAIEKIKEEYPEVAGPVSQAIDIVAGRVDAFDRVEQGRIEAAQRELNSIVDEQSRLLTEQHPGWEDLLDKNADVFRHWIEDQPLRMRHAFVQNIENITDAQQVGELISAFKTFINPPAAPAAPQQPLSDKRQRQLSGSSSPTRSSRAPVVSGIPEDGDPQAIWDAFEAQDQARARR